MTDKINGRTPEEIERSLKCRAMWGTPDCKMKCDECGTYVPGLNGSIMAAAAIDLIQQLERERDAAVRTARWQFERRGKDGMTKLPVCSWCGATPKYYAPMNDVGMQVPPYCHECGSRMSPLVKMEVE